MTHNSKDGKGSASADLFQFVQRRLPALSEAFASSPLMQLRVTTPRGSVTLVKSPGDASAPSNVDYQVEPRRGSRSPHDYLPDAEPGRAYETIAADVVGIFHAAPDLPEPGEHVEPDRVLGFIEALKLRTPVKSGIDGRMVGQVAEEDQPVDFGETLFIIDSGPAEAAPEEPPADAPTADVEPPRI